MLTKDQLVDYFILYLKDRYPELDLRIGTAVRDLVLEPLADLFLNFFNELNSLKNFLYGNIENEELLEKFLRNFFVSRKYGQKATGLVRVYVAEKKIYRVPPGTKFFHNETYYYVTQQEYVIPESFLFYNSLEGFWFFEIPTVAYNIGSQFNIKKGTILEPEPFDRFVLKAEAATDFIGGEDLEPIQDFVERAYKALVTRNLISARSIETVLKEEFDDVLKVTVIGFGDPEMWRDYKNSVKAHIGGHTDIWLKFKNKPKRITTRTDENGWIQNAPGLLRILTPNVKVLEVDRHTSFSPYPKVKTNLKNSTVEVEIAEQVVYIQSFLEKATSRPLTVNYLARAKIPVYLSGTIEITLKPGKNLDEVKANISNWIYSTDSFVISDLINKLYELGVDNVRLPLSITAEIITPTYDKVVLNVIDKFDYSNLEISNRTVTFYDGGLKLVTK